MARPYPSLTPEQQTEIIQRYKRGEPAQAIANSMRLGRFTVARTLRRKNILPTPGLQRNRIPDELKEQVAEMCLSGHTAVDIAKKFNVSAKTIYRLIEKYEFSLPRGPRKNIW